MVFEDSRTTVGDPEASAIDAPVAVEFAGTFAKLTDGAGFVDGVEVIAPVRSVAGACRAGAVTISGMPRGAVPILITFEMLGWWTSGAAILPFIAILEDGDRGDAVIPIF